MAINVMVASHYIEALGKMEEKRVNTKPGRKADLQG